MCTRVGNLKSTRTADNPYDVSFTATWSAGTPAVFGSMHTFDGGDPSHLRMDASSATGCTVFVEEETCSDAELAHTPETVHIFATVPQGGEACVATDAAQCTGWTSDGTAAPCLAAGACTYEQQVPTDMQVEVFVEEETCTDDELAHGNDHVGNERDGRAG